MASKTEALAPEPTPGERRPTVIVDDVHITYRVYASGKRMEESDGVIGGRLRKGIRGAREVHAVRGVSFTAHEGETIGVIGHNGSGKSSLFRAMTGLLPPTSGRIWAADRPTLLGVNAALLPELSGDKNVRLGLLALGFSPAEAAAAVPSVAEWADLQAFISHPMRTYSAGMGSRLRFAIASAKQHSILLIDEALSTGDRAFRAKSEARIRELHASAGTVLIVSHSMGSILDMSTRVIWMDHGQIRMDGDPEEVVDAYKFSTSSRSAKTKPIQLPERAEIERHKELLVDGSRVRIFARDRVDLTIAPTAMNFSAVRNGLGTHIFFRSDTKVSETLHSLSEDGLSFVESQRALRGEQLSHNFAAFWDRGRIRATGGRIVPNSPKRGADGLYWLRVMNTGKVKGPEQLLVGPDHPGFINGVERWGKSTEIDTQASVVYNFRTQQHLIYLTAHVAEGVRRLQVARATPFPEFGPFEEVVIEGLADDEQIHAPCFTAFTGRFVGFLPIVSERGGSIRIVESGDGVHFTPIDDFLTSAPWIDPRGALKNRDIPANGVVGVGDRLHLYVHRNYLGCDEGLEPYLERFTFAKKDFLSRN